MTTAKLSTTDLDHIDRVVRDVGKRMRREDRFDLRQELALKLLTRTAPPYDVFGWLRACAHNYVTDFWRAERNHMESRTSAPKPFKQDAASWWPKWYAPHDDAEEFAPFACAGARVIVC